jgi:hypothetical protein
MCAPANTAASATYHFDCILIMFDHDYDHINNYGHDHGNDYG